MPVATGVEFWGPCAWKFLHAIAFCYPSTPSDDQVAHFTKFFEGLPAVIPCPSCGQHAREHFTQHEGELKSALKAGGPALQRFMWKFHNAVNERRGVPAMPFEAVREIYTRGCAGDRPVPSTPAQWADPYHGMPRWAEVAAPDAMDSNNGADGAWPSTTTIAVAAGGAALLLVVGGWWFRSRRRSPSGAPNPPVAGGAPLLAEQQGPKQEL